MSLPPPPPPGNSVATATGETCFRHPNRPAGRRCTRCGRLACDDCLVQAPVGSHCVECAKAARPDIKTKAKYWNARQLTLVTYALIAVNLAVFLYTLIETPDTILGSTDSEGYFRLGLARNLLRYELVPGIPDGTSGQWYRLIS